MMQVMIIISFLLILYHIALYPLILTGLALLKKRTKPEVGLSSELPTVTILCAAYNEEDCIEEKIKSYLNLNYDKDKLILLIISDDSSDNTNNIVQKYVSSGYLELIIQKPRKGKQSGHNLVEPNITSKYVVSTDANSIFHPDAILELVRVIENEPRTGMVCGKLELIASQGAKSGETNYWSFESYLKKLESNIKTIICANGSLFIMRRKLFGQIHPASADDFERTLITIDNGYSAKYTDKAIVYEISTSKVIQEILRKKRIISQEWFVLKRQSQLLNIFHFPLAAFFLFSHKVIRWIIPIYAFIFFVLSAVLYKTPTFPYLFFAQTIFYIFGLWGMYLQSRNNPIPILRFPAYITAMIYSANIGFIRFLKGERVTLWQTSERK